MMSKSSLAGLLLVLLVPTLLLAPSLFGGRTFVPFDRAEFAPTATTLPEEDVALLRRDANYGPTEVVLTFVPELRFARQELVAGRLPQWNPYARFGVPLQATGVVGLDYPPNWLVLAHRDPQDGLALGAWLSFAIAGGLMFGCLRAFGLGVAAAVFGAFAFAISGTLVAQAHFYQRLASLVWLPGLLWSVHALTAAHGLRRGRAAAGLAACVALTLLAGFPAYGAPTLAVAGCYAMWRCLDGKSRTGNVVWLASALGLGVGLAAVQILPMLAFFPESSRGAPATDAGLASQGLAPLGLLGSLLMPGWLGHPHQHALDPASGPLAWWLLPRFDWATGHPFPPNWNFIEGTVFVGTLTLPLALFAALRPRSPFERALTIALLCLATLSGGHAWLGWLHQAGGVDIVSPMRFVAPMCGVLAVLAASGLHRLLTERATTRRRTFAWLLPTLGVGCIFVWQRVRAQSPEEFALAIAERARARFADAVPDLTVEGLRGLMGSADAVAAAHAAVTNGLLRAGLVLVVCGVWWGFVKWAARGPSWRAHLWRGIAIAGLIVELGSVAAPLLRGRELPVPHSATPVHEFLRAERDRTAADGGYTVVRGTTAPAEQKVLPIYALAPCQLVPERIRDLNGYTFLDRHSHRVLAAIWGDDHLIKGNVWPYCLPDDARLEHPYLDLLGVRYVLAEDAMQHAGAAVGPTLRGTRRRADGEPMQFHVFERPNALPRAFVVDELVAHGDDDSIIAALAATDLDPRRAVHVRDTRALEVRWVTPPTGSLRARDRMVRFVRDDVQELELEVAPGPAGWLVLNDAWFSGWSATVDERPVQLVRANLSMRAAVLPYAPGGEVTRVVFRYTPPRFALGLKITAVAALVTIVLVALAGFAARRRKA